MKAAERIYYGIMGALFAGGTLAMMIIYGSLSCSETPGNDRPDCQSLLQYLGMSCTGPYTASYNNGMTDIEIICPWSHATRISCYVSFALFTIYLAFFLLKDKINNGMYLSAVFAFVSFFTTLIIMIVDLIKGGGFSLKVDTSNDVIIYDMPFIGNILLVLFTLYFIFYSAKLALQSRRERFANFNNYQNLNQSIFFFFPL